MNVAGMAGVRARVAGLDLIACRAMADRALAASTVEEVRALLG